MEEKYIKFYQSFHKGFQNKKSNSLFCSSQSLSSRTKQWFTKLKKINSSYRPLIFITLIWIVICGSVTEWYAVNYLENHQSGWQFTGMIMMAIIVIPISFFLSQILEYFIKDIGKWIYLLISLILVPGIYLLLASGIASSY